MGLLLEGGDWGRGPNGMPVSALGGDEAVAGFARAPGLQFRGAPQLLRYELGVPQEDEERRGELMLVHRVGE